MIPFILIFIDFLNLNPSIIYLIYGKTRIACFGTGEYHLPRLSSIQVRCCHHVKKLISTWSIASAIGGKVHGGATARAGAGGRHRTPDVYQPCPAKQIRQRTRGKATRRTDSERGQRLPEISRASVEPKSSRVSSSRPWSRARGSGGSGGATSQ